MKIDSQTPLTRPSPADATREARAVEGGASVDNTAASPSSMTHLSSGINDSRQDVDMQRVAEIRDAIREGRLEINPERIADGLIESVRDMLGQDIPGQEKGQ
ncbi:flagellar biosynthesis anti-sigma factor FlgM [Halomonas cupida]|uniref:flagellar biosynthesis anti-sigma factor FlgM n=1 Tax=Halomonas cupida TaxID=44933 RepID=UPI003A8FD556